MINDPLDEEYYVSEYFGQSTEDESMYSTTLTKLRNVLTGNTLIMTLPGAFTPTCTLDHIPSFEAAAQDLKNLGIDNLYIMTTNDFYCQRVWLDSIGVKNFKIISDYEFHFANLFFNGIYRLNLGYRNSRQIFLFKGTSEYKRFYEKYTSNNDDPYEETKIDKVLTFLRENPMNV